MKITAAAFFVLTILSIFTAGFKAVSVKFGFSICRIKPVSSPIPATPAFRLYFRKY